MTDYGDYTPITVRSKTAQDAPTYTQADLDRIVKAAVDYASQKAAQEARAVALESVIANIRLDVENDDISTGAGQWIIDTILALLDTPAAEALKRVRAEAAARGMERAANLHDETFCDRRAKKSYWQSELIRAEAAAIRAGEAG